MTDIDTKTIYVIWWPAARVFKVGVCTSMARIRSLTSTGGEVLLLMRDRPAWEEKAALIALGESFDRAFLSEWDSLAVLPRGRGFTECFRVGRDRLVEALDTIFRGIAAYGNKQSKAAAGRPVHGRASDRVAAAGEVDGGGSEAVCGRPGPGAGELAPVEGGDLAVGRVGDAGGDRGSSADVGRGRVHRDIRVGGQESVRDGVVGEGEPSEAFTVPGSAAGSVPECFWKLSGIILGWGERGREGECERGRVGVRGCPVRKPARSSSVSVLQTPQTFRHHVQLSSLRHRTSRKRAVAGAPPGPGRRAAGRRVIRVVLS